jgi:hypothetical protein
MNGLMNVWYGMIHTIQSATAVLVITVCLAGIFAVVIFSIFKIRKINSNLAIIISTIIGCFLMIPVISAFNNLVDIKVAGAMRDEDRLDAENRVKQLEKEILEKQSTIDKQSIEIGALNDNINLLENAQLSMQSFQSILQIALLQTNLKQTLARKEAISGTTKGMGLFANYYNDEVLVVMTHDIEAKFGVDLKNVKIAKLDVNAVVVSGIKPMFIGASKNLTNTVVKEIRRNNYKNNVLDSIVVQNDSASKTRADKYAADYERDFQTKLANGLELDFMNDAVVQLAQNFIRIILAPLYREIKFDDAERSDALPLIQYLQKELEDNQVRRNNLQTINESLILANEELEAEVIRIETKQNLNDGSERIHSGNIN